jgi:tellurite resistance protein
MERGQRLKLNPVPPEIAHAGLRALKSVCLSSANATLTDLQKQFLSGVQKSILQTDFNLDSLQVISGAELADIVKPQEFKDRIIRACVVAAAIDGSVDPTEASFIDDFARNLDVDMAPVRTTWKLANQHLILARIDIVRKSLAGFKVKETFKNEGLLKTAKMFFPLLGIELPELTEKYKKLCEYPEGTLGREFINYIEKNKLPLPGEKGAAPEVIVVHDCLHILGGYGTTSTEEIEIAAFQAGCHSNDPIYGLLFGLAQYHLGIQVAPVAPSEKLKANPEKMMAAFARGCRVKKDMWADFKPWDYFDRNVAELRTEFGIES